MARRDWEAIASEFIKGDESLRELAKRREIPWSTVRDRAQREDWVGRRERFRSREGRDRVERLTGLLLDRIEQSLDGEEALPLKDLKAVTGALRELQELCTPEEKAGGSDTLTVRFVGESEEMSR